MARKLNGIELTRYDDLFKTDAERVDSKNGAEVMNLLTELNKEGTTIIMVTHSQHDASFAHRTVHLFDGSIVASVTA